MADQAAVRHGQKATEGRIPATVAPKRAMRHIGRMRSFDQPLPIDAALPALLDDGPFLRVMCTSFKYV